MKDEIIKKAGEMFLNLGFKSVTMDDLADALGVSKKTLYIHFANKSALVEAATQQVFESVCQGIDCIRHTHENPIKELFEINNYVCEITKSEKTSPQYQLQKYYPKTFRKLKKGQFDLMMDCVSDNLNTGIEMGLYRPEIDIKIVSRLYFLGATGIREQELFNLPEYPFSTVLRQFLEYHLRAIVTEKGKSELMKYVE